MAEQDLLLILALRLYLLQVVEGVAEPGWLVMKAETEPEPHLEPGESLQQAEAGQAYLPYLA